MLFERSFLDMEYCIRNMGILELSVFLTQIRQDLKKIGDPSQVIMSFFEKI